MNGQSLVGGLEKNSLSLFTVIEKMYQETTNSSPLLSNNYHRIYKYFSIVTSCILEISRMNSLVNTSQVLLNELCKAFFKKVSPKETKDRKAPLSHFPLFKQLNSTDNQWWCSSSYSCKQKKNLHIPLQIQWQISTGSNRLKTPNWI